MAQIYLFTGENSYELRRKRSFWAQEFSCKHGEENLLRLEARTTTFRALIDEVSVAPFIAEKRLVLMDGIPSGTKEEVEQLCRSIHPAVILLIAEPKPDKRLSVVKALTAVAQCEEFRRCSPAALEEWLTKEIAALGGSMHPEAKAFLLDRVGNEQELLVQECRKLVLYAQGREIRIEDIEMLVVCQSEKQVWELMDLLAQRKTSEAMRYVQRMLRQGESAVGLWNIFLWMISNLVPVAGVVEDGVTSPVAIAKQVGMNVRNVQTLLPFVRSMSRAQLTSLIERIVEYDIALKTGKIRASDQEPEELLSVIDRSLLACCAP
ncbi:MAG: DNA polymerase III subunit delta [Candidatus Peribacteraceae bacterium]|nr:DNA polymerase III subunit delta [Candidatus Peribacteraceae bacterium]